jgi:uncharacterized protein (TIGR02001 family)
MEVRAHLGSPASAQQTAVFVFAFLILFPLFAHAGVNYGVLAKFTSNYVYRGYSKSSGDPVFQGNVDAEHSTGMFIGTWISQVNFGSAADDNGASIELSPYAGRRFSLLEDWSLETTLAAYLYDGKVNAQSADYGELGAQLYFRDLIAARIGLSHDAYGTGHSIQDYELLSRYPINSVLDASGSVAYSEADAVFAHDNLYWNIGVTWFWRRYAAIDLRFYGLQEVGVEPREPALREFHLPGIEHHLVISVSVGF